MDTSDIPIKPSVAASAPPLAADDPRLTPEAIEYRRANALVERDEFGRLLPGSQLPNKGRKGGPMVWDKRQRGYHAMGYKIGSETETQTTIRL